MLQIPASTEGEMNKKPSIKRIILGLLALLLILIPTFLAILYVHHENTTQTAEVFSVTLYDPSGNEFGHDIGSPQSGADDLLGIFYYLSQNKRVISLPTGDPESDPHFRAVISLDGNESEWTCYFSPIENAGYFIDELGQICAIPVEYNQKFLDTSYGEYLHGHAKSPQLITADSDVILPSTSEWNYKISNGSFLTAQNNRQTEEILAYDITGELGIRFSSEPTACEVRVYDHSTLLYTGSHHSLSTLTVDTGNELSVTIRAVWQKTAGSNAYGEQTYRFLVRIRNRSAFSLGNDTLPAGGFTILSCSNISDLQKISLTSDLPALGYSFSHDGEQVRTLLYFPVDTPIGAHHIKITYGASARIFTVYITEPAPVSSFLYAGYDTTMSPTPPLDSFATFAELTNALSIGQKDSSYFRGNFLDPTTQGFTISYRHGDAVTWGTTTSAFVGTEFVTDQPGGASVRAVNNGIVVAVGETDWLGKYAVVDHGCGLKTWYGHLSVIDIGVGDILIKGQSLGKTGTGGLATSQGFLLICTVYDATVDPSLILGKEIPLT